MQSVTQVIELTSRCNELAEEKGRSLSGGYQTENDYLSNRQQLCNHVVLFNFLPVLMKHELFLLLFRPHT